MKESGGVQGQDWRSEQGAMSEGQWSIRMIGVIGRSGDCRNEEGREEKGDIIALCLLNDQATFYGE